MFIDDILRYSKRHAIQINNDFKSLKSLGIEDVAIWRIRKNSEFSLISSDAVRQEEFWGDQLYKHSKFLVSPAVVNKKQYVFSIGQLYDINTKENLILNHLKRFDIVNALLIAEKRNDCLYCYAFGSSNKHFNAVKIANLVTSFIHKKSAKIEFHLNQTERVMLSGIIGMKFYKPSQAMPMHSNISKSNYVSNINLSEQEYEFATIFNESISCKEVAYSMNLTLRTIQNYVTDLKKKLGLDSIYELRSHLKTMLAA